jgi:hypothetical protein
MSDLTSVPGAHSGPFSQIVDSPGQGEARPPLGARPSVHSEPQRSFGSAPALPWEAP